jgi:D-threo-aldose 1-dehydrogenase
MRPGQPGERTLGRSELTLPPLGLGTAPLGGLYTPLSDVDAAATLDRAASLGVRFFDTAPLYGHGLAETRLGAFLERCPETPVISTKVGRLLREDAPPDPAQAHNGVPFFPETPPVSPVFDFSAAAIRRSLEESLERLCVDTIDIAFLHDPDAHFERAATEAAPALAELKQEGLVQAIGVGMNQWEMLIEFSKLGIFDCFLLANRYTLLDQSALAELLPCCLERGISVIVGGVFNSGVLADPHSNPRFDYVPATNDVVERADAIHEIAARYEVPVPALAIQFPLSHPAVVSVLVGARTPAEVEANVAGLQHEIPTALWDELCERAFIPAEAPVPG